MGQHDQIKEIFTTCSNGQGCVDFQHTCAQLWTILDNNLSLCDISGVFTVANPDSDNWLDLLLFNQFFGGVARIKYSLGPDNVDRLVQDILKAKTLRCRNDPGSCINSIDKNVMRVLLKFDMPLRRAFSNFAGKDIAVGGSLTWEEVKKRNIGMEIDGYVALAGAYSIIPSLSLQQCAILAREVATQYPLLATASSAHTQLLYPQFQLLLVLTAIERNNSLLRTINSESKIMNATTSKLSLSMSASKRLTAKNTEFVTVADMLSDLLKAMGISILTRPHSASAITSGRVINNASLTAKDLGPAMSTLPNQLPSQMNMTATGNIELPSTTRPSDSYNMSGKHNRQTMIMRMDSLFEDVAISLQEVTYSKTCDPTLSLLPNLFTNNTQDDMNINSSKINGKPVVIADALPVPTDCPPSVEQLLESALAHHNLNSFVEALKFLEAARVDYQQLIETSVQQEVSMRKGDEGRGGDDDSLPSLPSLKDTNSKRRGKAVVMQKETQPVSRISPSIDIELYIMLCKGNVYQSSGEDELALVQYVTAWRRAMEEKSADWEAVSLNSIGLLCYFALRYDLALNCFAEVTAFRYQSYGNTSADTATAWNNLACCLYCTGRAGDARVRFERAYNTLSKVLGQRHPRAVVAWRNLDKSKRSHASVVGCDYKELIQMREDQGKIIVGSFTIAAKMPLLAKKAKLKSGGKKSKSKK